MDGIASAESILFEGFRLDRRGGCLFRLDQDGMGTPVALGSRALDLLGLLVERKGELVSKNAIMAAVWPGRVVEDANLNVQISKLRHILDQNREQGSCIQTIPGRGYCFVAMVTQPIADAPSIAVVSEGGVLPRPRLSIVVLPFANLSDDRDQQFFADGITDDLTTDLSRIADSFVIARNTAFTYKNRSVDAKQIGRELGVRYVLEGSLRRADDRVRVNVQLIDADSGAHLWADRFDTDRANLAGVQNEITGRLAQSLNLELVEAVGRRIEQESPVDPDAQAFVMRGWAWYYRATSAATIQEAERAFEQALEIDRSSIDARVGIATLLVRKLAEGWSPPRREDEARAEQFLLEALERDTNRSTAHYAMGMLRRVQNRLAEARIEFEKTIALDRNHARAFFRHGQTLMYLGRPEAGIPYIEKAIRLNPRDPNIARPYANLGLCHLLLGHVDEAIDLLRQARAANPRFYWIHKLLAGALGCKGDLDEARAALAEAMRLNPEVNSFARWRAYMPWITGPQHWALLERTLNIGLRRADFPDE